MNHNTIEEAAKKLKISDKTLREWIIKGIVSEPPSIPNGTVFRRYFPDDLIEKYERQIAAKRDAKKLASNQKKKR